MSEIIEVIGTIGIWILIFWVPFQIKRLNQTISAQSKLIESFELQSSYIGNVQETMSRLYDPKEIEAIVTAKVEASVNEHKKEQSQNLKNSLEMIINMYSEDITSLVTFAMENSWHLSKKDFENSVSEYLEASGNVKLVELMRTSYEKYNNAYQDALLNALENRSNDQN